LQKKGGILRRREMTAKKMLKNGIYVKGVKCGIFWILAAFYNFFSEREETPRNPWNSHKK
jgi:hypothetical protein